jgi:CsoR family transcriptional regulator, copper-sensing transcriptional repressor
MEALRITDSEAKGHLKARLARIEGQIRGLQEMIEREGDCEQIAQQTVAVRVAFHKFFAEMIANELQAIEAEKHMSAEARHKRWAALVNILSKYA